MYIYIIYLEPHLTSFFVGWRRPCILCGQIFQDIGHVGSWYIMITCKGQGAERPMKNVIYLFHRQQGFKNMYHGVSLSLESLTEKNLHLYNLHLLKVVGKKYSPNGVWLVIDHGGK